MEKFIHILLQLWQRNVYTFINMIKYLDLKTILNLCITMENITDFKKEDLIRLELNDNEDLLVAGAAEAFYNDFLNIILKRKSLKIRLLTIDYSIIFQENHTNL